MSTYQISEINPIALTAVVSSVVGGGYTVVTQYNEPPPVAVVDVLDTFVTLPSTLTVNITSSTVPAGYHLAATGAGTWTAVSSSAITGTFTVVAGSGNAFTFTVIVTNGTTILAQHDPKITARKLGSL